MSTIPAHHEQCDQCGSVGHVMDYHTYRCRTCDDQVCRSCGPDRDDESQTVGECTICATAAPSCRCVECDVVLVHGDATDDQLCQSCAEREPTHDELLASMEICERAGR